MSATIELTDIGPVEHLSIPIPDEGGVIVLRGANGTGKSSTLRAVDRLATGKKSIELSARDGAAKGQISGCGVTLRVGRSVSRTGELEVESLDGRLSVAELVDPGLKGAEEADGRRIRALVQLAGVEPDVELFAGLFDSPEEFAEITRGASLDTDDILVLADRIKRAIEAAARNAEGIANQERAKAAACRESVAGIDTDVPTDEAALQQTLEEAVRHDQELRSKAQEAARRFDAMVEAKLKIESAKKKSGGMSVEETRQRLAEAEGEHEKRTAEVLDLQQRLTEAVEAEKRSAADLQHWRERVQDAEFFAAAITNLEETIAAGEIQGPSDADLEDAAAGVMDARKAIEDGAMARRAREKIAKAKEHADAEARASDRAESLREAAKRVDDVLSEQIAKLGVPLQVRGGRLVTTNHKRGTVLYAELSEGERWRLALDIAIEAVGKNGLLSIPQAAYEGLDPENRRMIAEHVRGRGVVILTAEATDGPIRAEIG